MSTKSREPLYLILSMERTGQPGPWGPEGVHTSKACVWWRPAASGYTTSIGEAGRYTIEEVIRYADPPHHVPIPLEVIEVPASQARKLLSLASCLADDVAKLRGQQRRQPEPRKLTGAEVDAALALGDGTREGELPLLYELQHFGPTCQGAEAPSNECSGWHTHRTFQSQHDARREMVRAGAVEGGAWRVIDAKGATCEVIGAHPVD